MIIKYTVKNIMLKATFTSIRSSLNTKEFGFIRIENKEYFGIGELAPIHTFGENIVNCSEQVIKIVNLAKALNSNQFLEWLSINYQNYFPSVIHAFETALLDFLSKSINKPLFELLSLPSPNNRKSCITIPMNYSMSQIYEILNQFPDSTIKVKLSSSPMKDINRIESLRKISTKKLWIDAEGVFTSTEMCVDFIEQIDKNNILVLEDPFSFEPNIDWSFVRQYCNVIVDRYFIKQELVISFKDFVDGFNIKPVRFSGLSNSIKTILDIKNESKIIVLGCLLETGVNISNSFALAGLVDYIDLDSYTFFQDNPYNGLIWGKNGISYINNFGNGIK